jgi:hypothetical protein
MESLKDRYEEAFKKINPDITADDRSDAVKELNIHPVTVANYAGGNLKYCNVDTADKLLAFFTERIEQRKQRLDKVLKTS